MANIRLQREAMEELLVCGYGVRAAASRGRPTPEPECEMRTCFQRDVDRITHAINYLYGNLISRYSHILRYWDLGFNI